jgi:hypothetical protein
MTRGAKNLNTGIPMFAGVTRLASIARPSTEAGEACKSATMHFTCARDPSYLPRRSRRWCCVAIRAGRSRYFARRGSSVAMHTARAKASITAFTFASAFG